MHRVAMMSDCVSGIKHVEHVDLPDPGDRLTCQNKPREKISHLNVFHNRIEEWFFFILKICQSPLVFRLLVAPRGAPGAAGAHSPPRRADA
ncbi:hypothetical protein B0G73_10239 [Paraburkholderia sp. BL25I1N1]|nr:hypothetical protein B0G73_10239 [Paraburkholderia sp. BL25I1N1]